MEKKEGTHYNKKRSALNDGFPLTKVSGLAEIKGSMILFTDYALHKSSEIICLDADYMNKEYFQSFILHYIEENIKIEDIIKGKIVFPSDGNNNTDIVSKTCNMILAEVKNVALKGIEGLFDELIDIGTISRPIKSDINTAMYEMVNMLVETMSKVFAEYFADNINLNFSVANNGIEIKTYEVTREIKELFLSTVKDAFKKYFSLSDDRLEFYNRHEEIKDELIIYAAFYYDREFKYDTVKSPDIEEKDLLISLCNFYLQSKDFIGVDPNKAPNMIPYPNAETDETMEEYYKSPIIKWCEKNFFPYQLRHIMAMLKTNPDENTLRSHLYNFNGYDLLQFKVKDFAEELRVLTETTVKLIYISKMKHENQFEAEKWVKTCKNLDISKFIQAYNKDDASKKQMTEELLQNARHLKMGLHYNPGDDTITLASAIDSVFDIAWNALIRIITFYKYLVKEDEKGSERHVDLGFCRYCGGIFFKSCSHNDVCKDDDCQKKRNNDKERAAYKRRKEKRSNTPTNEPKQ